MPLSQDFTDVGTDEEEEEDEDEGGDVNSASDDTDSDDVGEDVTLLGARSGKAVVVTAALMKPRPRSGTTSNASKTGTGSRSGSHSNGSLKRMAPPAVASTSSKRRNIPLQLVCRPPTPPEADPECGAATVGTANSPSPSLQSLSARRHAQRQSLDDISLTDDW